MTDKHTLLLMTAADTDAMLKAATPGSFGVGRYKTTSFVVGSDAPQGQAAHELVYNVLSENGSKKDAFRPGATFLDSLLVVPIPESQLDAVEEKFNIIRVTNAQELFDARQRLQDEARARLGIGRRDSGGNLGV